VQLIPGPLRADDLIHTQRAILAQTEQLIARDRLDLSRVTQHNSCFVLRLNSSERLLKWWALQTINPHLWLDSAEVDSLGTNTLFSHRCGEKPSAAFAAVCSWRDLPVAAAHLRRRYIAPVLLEGFGSSVLSKTIEAITHELQLPQRPANSSELPNCCETAWGHLLGNAKDTLLVATPPGFKSAALFGYEFPNAQGLFTGHFLSTAQPIVHNLSRGAYDTSNVSLAPPFLVTPVAQFG
jgi:hypothetical protein